jgi:uncharacterized membrane protein
MSLALLVLFSSLFAVTHIGMSHDPYRSRMSEKLGEKPFMGVYSLVSLLTLGGAIWVFAVTEDLGPVLWTLPTWLHPVVYLLVLMAFLLVALAFANPSPAGMAPAPTEVHGVLRITRHPMNMGIASFALAHMMANGVLGDLFFFGSLFVVGFFGPFHQDRRKVREKGDSYVAFREQTSAIPFAAIISGKTRLEIGEIRLPFAVAAVVVYLAVAMLHGKLFGVSPF